MTSRAFLIAMCVVAGVTAMRYLLIPHFIMATVGESRNAIHEHFAATHEPLSFEIEDAAQRTILRRGEWIVYTNLALDTALLASLIALFALTLSSRGINARMASRTERTRS